MIFDSKIRRIQQGGIPRVLDLFAGCGGISLGFHRAGFEVIGAVEYDPYAAKSHALNFHPTEDGVPHPVHSIPTDITQLDPSDLFNNYSYEGDIEDAVDVIVGGPPCQAFARVGRAKLREVAESPEAFLSDPRGNLYLRYLDYVRELKPIALLMENVPDVLNYGGHNIAEETAEILDRWGYQTRYTLLNAVHFGVPSMRERMFLVAYRAGVEIEKWFPDPTYRYELPIGYTGTRQVALQTISVDLFYSGHYLPASSPDDKLPKAVSAQEALGDLPELRAHLNGGLKKGPRRFKEWVKYGMEPQTTYQQNMREWPGFEASDGIKDHVIRFLPRDYKIFARMEAGDQYPQAYALANKMLQEALDEIELREGDRVPPDSKRYMSLVKEYVPPYDPGKFPNKWRKMEPDHPARTLMAHLGKDSYSHIHYNSSQARTISVREAARLQSFPDGFVFEGPMNPAFRQIGNAVPPLLASAIAKLMMKQLTRKA